LSGDEGVLKDKKVISGTSQEVYFGLIRGIPPPLEFHEINKNVRNLQKKINSYASLEHPLKKVYVIS